MIKRSDLMIGDTPASVYGEKSDKAFLFIHGFCGNRFEAERFADVVMPYGFQVLSVDLPEHGGRTDNAKLLPWEVVPKLQAVMRYAKRQWSEISVRATSIGAWFSLQAFGDDNVKSLLMVSPVVDMETMIKGMMMQNTVTEERLRSEGEIPTDGQTLSWKYLCWVRDNPVKATPKNTAILYAVGDEMISRSDIDGFLAEHNARLTLFEGENGGHHWFHTEEEVAFMTDWESREITALN